MGLLYTRQYRAIIFFDRAFFWIGSFAANTQFYVDKTFMTKKKERKEEMKKNYRNTILSLLFRRNTFFWTELGTSTVVILQAQDVEP
jgi:hypothetical protein